MAILSGGYFIDITKCSPLPDGPPRLVAAVRSLSPVSRVELGLDRALQDAARRFC